MLKKVPLVGFALFCGGSVQAQTVCPDLALDGNSVIFSAVTIESTQVSGDITIGLAPSTLPETAKKISVLDNTLTEICVNQVKVTNVLSSTPEFELVIDDSITP